MAGLKAALLDKSNDTSRGLNGQTSDFIRGYKTLPTDSWWDKFNNRLTQKVADFGKSYGKRF